MPVFTAGITWTGPLCRRADRICGNWHESSDSKDMNFPSRIFIKGLAVVTPVVGTVLIVVWLGTSLEKFILNVFGTWIPSPFPGSGILLGVVLVVGVGVLAHFWIFKKFMALLDKGLSKAPLVKAIYGSLKDVSGFVYSSDEEGKKLGQAVLVNSKALEMELVGFEMVNNLAEHDLGSELPDASEKVVVYFPMSYQIGGYMAVVNKKSVQPLDISTEEALRLTLTAGVRGRESATE